MTALLEVEGVSKAFGGVQALTLLRPRGAEGADQRADRAQRLGQDDALQRDHRLRAGGHGRGPLRRAAITNSTPGPRLQLGIGRTFQLTRIFARLTVLENMLVATQRARAGSAACSGSPARQPERRRARELLDFVGIARLAAEPAGNLSFGQRKLLELASLLVADPAVLLLDEPAGGVNPTLIDAARGPHPRAQRGGQDVPRRRAQHGVRDVAVHRVTVLNQGRTLVSGTPPVVRADPRVLDAYLGPRASRDEPTRASRRDPGRGTRPPEQRAAPRRARASRASSPATAAATSSRTSRSRCPRAASPASSAPTAPGSRRCSPTISGLLRPRRGEISFRGEVAHRPRPAAMLARGISLVPQAHSLFPQMTVRENVEMGAFTIRDRALVAQRLRGVEELFPIVRSAPREGREPLGRPAAARRVRPLADARPAADDPR